MLQGGKNRGELKRAVSWTAAQNQMHLQRSLLKVENSRALMRAVPSNAKEVVAKRLVPVEVMSLVIMEISSIDGGITLIMPQTNMKGMNMCMEL